MAKTWNKDRSSKRIDTRLAEVALKDIDIKEYVRDTDLTSLSNRTAYRVNGVHLYADILNMTDMLNVTNAEGEICHRRTLRFLNLHYRAVYRILQRTGVILVDFHNQRLHAVIAKPYGDETARVQKAVAVAQLIIDVLARTGEDADHPAARVRVGIDTGLALAVNNGRRGHREPLFLGEPANRAAKRSVGGTVSGIFLTNNARSFLGLEKAANEDARSLTNSEIQACEDAASIDVEADDIVEEWQRDLESLPIGTFEFSGHTPPFATLDFELLNAKNSRRQDAMSLYADLDGFTNYVSSNVTKDADSKHVVRVLHVLRSELDAVLHEDFGGRKVRFIGDCVHGIMAEGTAQTTDVEETVSTATLCAAGMRSGFALAQEKLKQAGSNADTLGLQIGFEYGPMNATRLGMKGDKIRCSVSRGVLQSEKEQGRCLHNETAIGPNAYAKASEAVRLVFGETRKRADLTYSVALEEMKKKNDRVAKIASAAEGGLLQSVAAASSYTFPSQRTGPTKPGGFA